MNLSFSLFLCVNDDLFLLLAKVTPLIQEGEWWRLITATYLHAGFLHLIFNIISQLVIGLQTEQFIGWWRMAFIYFWSGTNSIEQIIQRFHELFVSSDFKVHLSSISIW